MSGQQQNVFRGESFESNMKHETFGNKIKTNKIVQIFPSNKVFRSIPI